MHAFNSVLSVYVSPWCRISSSATNHENNWFRPRGIWTVNCGSCGFLPQVYFESFPENWKAECSWFYLGTHYELGSFIQVCHFRKPGLLSGSYPRDHRCLNITIPHCSQLRSPQRNYWAATFGAHVCAAPLYCQVHFPSQLSAFP